MLRVIRETTLAWQGSKVRTRCAWGFCVLLVKHSVWISEWLWQRAVLGVYVPLPVDELMHLLICISLLLWLPWCQQSTCWHRFDVFHAVCRCVSVVTLWADWLTFVRAVCRCISAVTLWADWLTFVRAVCRCISAITLGAHVLLANSSGTWLHSRPLLSISSNGSRPVCSPRSSRQHRQ